jgi:hypothetical protein
LLRKLGLLAPDLDIMLIAPELFMMAFLDKIEGLRLFACNVSSEQYKPRIRRRVDRVDLCTDLPGFEPGRFDVIIHNHVLEHVPCAVIEVLKGLNRLVKPGGLPHLLDTDHPDPANRGGARPGTPQGGAHPAVPPGGSRANLRMGLHGYPEWSGDDRRPA